MRRLFESEEVRARVPEILRMAGEQELADRFEKARRAADLVEALGERLDDVASVLEKVAVDSSYDVVGAQTIDFATALRLYGPPEARKGEPLRWESENGRLHIAVDHKGTEWDIAPGIRGYGLTVARWDRPDWWADTLEEAKDLAAEVVARPSFSGPPREADIETPYED